LEGDRPHTPTNPAACACQRLPVGACCTVQSAGTDGVDALAWDGRRCQPVGAEYPVTLCDLGILMDQAAEPVSAENPDIRARSGWMRTPGRRALQL